MTLETENNCWLTLSTNHQKEGIKTLSKKLTGYLSPTILRDISTVGQNLPSASPVIPLLSFLFPFLRHVPIVHPRSCHLQRLPKRLMRPSLGKNDTAYGDLLSQKIQILLTISQVFLSVRKL